MPRIEELERYSSASIIISRNKFRMADYIELGLEAVDYLIEHYFDEIADAVFHPRQALRNIRHRSSSKEFRFPILDRLIRRRARTSSTNQRDSRRKSQDDSDVDSTYSDGVYSPRTRSAGPRTDPYYNEAQRRTSAYNVPPTDLSQRDPRYPARHRDPHAMNHDPYPPRNPYTWASAADSRHASQSGATPAYTVHHAPTGPLAQAPRRDEHAARTSLADDERTNDRGRSGGPARARASRMRSARAIGGWGQAGWDRRRGGFWRKGTIWFC
jgi:hypothetical protein